MWTYVKKIIMYSKILIIYNITIIYNNHGVWLSPAVTADMFKIWGNVTKLNLLAGRAYYINTEKKYVFITGLFWRSPTLEPVVKFCDYNLADTRNK